MTVYRTNDTDLGSVADAIRTKGGTSANLQFPSGFVSAIQNIQTGTDDSDATLNSSGQLLNGVTAYSKGTKYTGNIATKTDANLSASGATVTVPSGYYAQQYTKNVSSGSATAPSSISGTSATVSNSGTTLTLSKTVSVTPSVTAGYVSSGTAGNSAVSLSATDANFLASNIKSGVSLFGLTGTYSGGGSGGLTLLGTSSLGTLSTSSTSATDTGKSFTINSVTDYDVLVCDISVDTVTNGRHIGTITMVYLTGTSNVNTKNTAAVGSNKWNIKVNSSGTKSTRQSSTAYGVYVNAATLSSGNITCTVYYRYNSNNSGTINGDYTAHVYGLKLVDYV